MKKEIKSFVRLFTKTDIIRIWNKMDNEKLSKPCCPYCRDTLVESNDNLIVCTNIFCENESGYKHIKDDEYYEYPQKYIKDIGF